MIRDFSPAFGCASAEDIRFMRAALAFGRRHLGRTAENPSVGALVVRDGVIVGRGATAVGGRPHAEVFALEEAGALARGSTLYTTLEPCSHHGRTSPCIAPVLAAGITRVVSAIEDPDPRVEGDGYRALRAHNVEVVTGVCHEEALCAHLGHIRRIHEGRPKVLLKMAETADGYAAAGLHDPRLYITGLHSEKRVHMLRALHDVIMIGIGTVRKDDPLLTVRLPGVDWSPLRVILDPNLTFSLKSRLAQTASQHPTLIFTTKTITPALRDMFADYQIELATAKADGEGRLNLLSVLQALAKRGVTRVYAEGGPTIASRLIMQGLADKVILFRGPRPLAREGVPSLHLEARTALANPEHWTLIDQKNVGMDRMRCYSRADLCKG